MPSVQVRMALAVRQVDVRLGQKASRFPEGLSEAQLVFSGDWEPSVSRIDGVLVGCSKAEFDGLSSIERQLEVNRAHAEALLAKWLAGVLALTEEECERLLWRALGLVLVDEDDRLCEVASCAELAPNYVTAVPDRMLPAIEKIERHWGQATALAYAFLLLAGVRSPADLRKYGIRIQAFLDRVTERFAVAGKFAEMAREGIWGVARTSRLRLLDAVREQLWRERPIRIGGQFLLTQVIDGYLGLRPGGVGDSLGLSIADAVLLAKMTFPVRFKVREGRFLLEILVSSSGEVEYWDPIDRRSQVPAAMARNVGLRELLVEGYLRLARGYVQGKSYSNAARVARWAIGLHPRYGPAHEVLAEALLGLVQPREAIAAAETAFGLDPLLADAQMVRGNALMALSRWREAITAYKKAIALRVGYAEAYNNLGLALQRNGEPVRAEGAYQEATRIRPDYVEARYNLGNLLLQQDRLDEAISQYERAIEESPSFAGAHYNMGQAYYRKGEPRLAKDCYLKAVEANPKHAGAWHNLGIVYRDIGAPDKAVEAIARAVSLNPTLLR